MTENISIKVSDYGKAMLQKLKVNRIKSGTEDDVISFAEALDIITYYLKNNNDTYLDIVNMEKPENGFR